VRRVYEDYGLDPAAQRRWGASPGNRAMLKERDDAVLKLLSNGGRGPRVNGRVLEVGCGGGRNLSLLAGLGIPVGSLYGVDLMPERIQEARRRLPGANFECLDATQLPYSDGFFGLVLLFTVMSSILDRQVAGRISAEVCRVLGRNRGTPRAILWYDMRMDNPRNRNIRGISRTRIQELFPGYSVDRLRSITLLPPLARALGSAAPWFYRPLAAIPALRTHYLGLLKPIAVEIDWRP